MRAAHTNRFSVAAHCCSIRAAPVSAHVQATVGSSRDLRCHASFEDAPVSGSSLLGPAVPSKASGKKSQSAEERLNAIELKSGRGVDYEPLRQALLEKDFLKADDIHRKKLIEVAGEAAQERGWVYFTEVKDIPVEDLQTIDQLWLASSGDKFGFSVQKQIWKVCKMKWARFFVAIDWLKGENQNYRAWPAEFMYTVEDATKGHLPLTNALRGTQLFEAILTHPAFVKENEGKNAWD